MFPAALQCRYSHDMHVLQMHMTNSILYRAGPAHNNKLAKGSTRGPSAVLQFTWLLECRTHSYVPHCGRTGYLSATYTAACHKNATKMAIMPHTQLYRYRYICLNGCACNGRLWHRRGCCSSSTCCCPPTTCHITATMTVTPCVIVEVVMIQTASAKPWQRLGIRPAAIASQPLTAHHSLLHTAVMTCPHWNSAST
jgi:hypothetical protein